MTLVVPNVGEVKNLQLWLGTTLTLKLYANDVVPGEADTAGTYTEVTGGGYLPKSLLSGDWTITPGAPSAGIHPAQDWTFTGATGGSGQVYGYYVVDPDGVLRWAERFEETVIPFVPASGRLIRVVPRFQTS